MSEKIRKIISSLAPSLATRFLFFRNFGKLLNLKNPEDINEKLQYLKLKTYYNNPTITQCVDKYLVRDYLEKNGFEALLPELLGGGIALRMRLKRTGRSIRRNL